GGAHPRSARRAHASDRRPTLGLGHVVGGPALRSVAGALVTCGHRRAGAHERRLRLRGRKGGGLATDTSAAPERVAPASSTELTIEELHARAFSIPTDTPESDGTELGLDDDRDCAGA